jgi:hypothetical protein
MKDGDAVNKESMIVDVRLQKLVTLKPLYA